MNFIKMIGLVLQHGSSIIGLLKLAKEIVGTVEEYDVIDNKNKKRSEFKLKEADKLLEKEFANRKIIATQTERRKLIHDVLSIMEKSVGKSKLL